MIRVLGAFSVMWGSVLLRGRILHLRREKLKEQAELLRSLRLLRMEIQTALRPLPELLTRDGYVGAGRRFFATVGAIYGERPDAELAAVWKEQAACIPCSEEVKDALSTLADSFAASEQELERAFERTEIRMEKDCVLRHNELREQERTITAVCLSSGIILSIMAI